MSRKKQSISDELAKEALRYGGKSGAVPMHDAMQAEDEDFDTNAEDTEDDDLKFDEDAGDKGY